MIELPPDLEHQLREKAAHNGQDILDYLRWVVEKDLPPVNAVNRLKPEDYPDEGKDWTEEDLQIDLDWALAQRRTP